MDNCFSLFAKNAFGNCFIRNSYVLKNSRFHDSYLLLAAVKKQLCYQIFYGFYDKRKDGGFVKPSSSDKICFWHKKTILPDSGFFYFPLGSMFIIFVPIVGIENV